MRSSPSLMTLTPRPGKVSRRGDPTALPSGEAPTSAEEDHGSDIRPDRQTGARLAIGISGSVSSVGSGQEFAQSAGEHGPPDSSDDTAQSSRLDGSTSNVHAMHDEDDAEQLSQARTTTTGTRDPLKASTNTLRVKTHPSEVKLSTTAQADAKSSREPDYVPLDYTKPFWHIPHVWGRLPTRPMRAHTATLVQFDEEGRRENAVYVFGGCDAKSCLRDIWKLDLGKPEPTLISASHAQGLC